MRETGQPNPGMSDRIETPAAESESDRVNRGDKKTAEFLQQVNGLREKLLSEGEPSPAAVSLWENLIEWHDRLERPGYYDFDQNSEKIVQRLTGQEDSDILSWSLIENFPPNQEKLQAMTDREKKLLQNTVDNLNCARMANLEQRVTNDVLCHELYNKRYFDSLFLHEVSRVKKISAANPENVDAAEGNNLEHERMINRGKSFVILFDINDFRQYNNQYGHLRGDQVLKEMAQTMRNNFRRQSDVLARVGGDEFAMITRSHTEENLVGFMNKFIAEMNRKGIKIGLGVSEILPTDSDGIEESWNCAYHRADLAGKLAKDMTKKGMQGNEFKGLVISTPDPEKKRTKHHYHNFTEHTNA